MAFDPGLASKVDPARSALSRSGVSPVLPATGVTLGRRTGSKFNADSEAPVPQAAAGAGRDRPLRGFPRVRRGVGMHQPALCRRRRLDLTKDARRHKRSTGSRPHWFFDLTRCTASPKHAFTRSSQSVRRFPTGHSAHRRAHHLCRSASVVTSTRALGRKKRSSRNFVPRPGRSGSVRYPSPMGMRSATTSSYQPAI